MSSFRPPQKAIVSPADLALFAQSQTHADVVSFITSLSSSVLNTPLSHPTAPSPAVDALAGVLSSVEALVDAHPAQDHGTSRFGNPAFRPFLDAVRAQSAGWLAAVPGVPTEAVGELKGYFDECWGNRERIDYGSGMELNFVCLLLCLSKLGVFTVEDQQALVLKLFWGYIKVMRVLQKTYWLEPAGSHGVWGLDDYHFLPFLFGAAQLEGHKYLKPKSIHDADVLDSFKDEYMYLACIHFINSIKTATLRWHSPMLDDISAVRAWSKVHSGMHKMYAAEVLGKLPVVQHFLFGSLLPAPEGVGRLKEGEERVEHEGHSHVRTVGDVKGEMFGDCCGIPVPSAFAAGLEVRQGGLKLAEIRALDAARSGGAGLVPVD